MPWKTPPSVPVTGPKAAEVCGPSAWDLILFSSGHVLRVLDPRCPCSCTVHIWASKGQGSLCPYLLAYVSAILLLGRIQGAGSVDQFPSGKLCIPALTWANRLNHA